MKQLFFSLLLVFSLYAEELDTLLDTYSYNSDLSEKTKLENGGTVIIYTRQDIERMQARSLKDLLKSHPILRYKESRYGTPDMQYKGGSATFSSSSVRLYIDNQELTSATFGSGFLLSRFIDFSVIDHVEIYSRSPSYEFSTEPTYLLIKLYTKVAKRDRGGRIELSYGSRDFNQESLFYADEFEDFSYVSSITHQKDKKKTYKSHDIPIQRDTEQYTFFGSIYSQHHKVQLLAGKPDADLSMAQSPRGTYAVSEGSFDYFHLGYETSYFKDTFLALIYEQAQLKGDFQETTGYEASSPNKDISRRDHIVTAEAKHTFESDENRLIIGAKFRHKKFILDHAIVSGSTKPTPDYDTQTLYSVFAENRYSFSDHNILSFAGQYTRAVNNADKDNEDLIQARISHTYLYHDFIFKSFAYRIESLVEPYIYVSFPTVGSLQPQVLNALSEEIKYKYNKNDLTFLLTYNRIDNLFEESPSGGFVNKNETVKNISSYLEHTYHFDLDNKLTSNISYLYVQDVQRQEIAAFIRMLNTFGKYDVFNEVIYNHNNINYKQYFDYSLGLKYHYNHELTLSIKGENIFDKGYENTYSRYDPVLDQPETPILISPVEQRVYVSMEYLF